MFGNAFPHEANTLQQRCSTLAHVFKFHIQVKSFLKLNLTSGYFLTNSFCCTRGFIITLYKACFAAAARNFLYIIIQYLLLYLSNKQRLRTRLQQQKLNLFYGSAS